MSARQAVCALDVSDRSHVLLTLAYACEQGEDMAQAFWEALAWAAGAPYAGPDKDLQRIAQDLTARRAYVKQATSQARRDARIAFGWGSM